LDAHLQPVPIGVTGEVYIAGDGLARGYLNRPELTAQKFILNPFCGSGERQGGLEEESKIQTLKLERLYKTGDLARYLPDGNLEFVDRIDDQVKIRGFRIELGEIEALLTQHPTVREAVASIHENASTDKRIIAYIVPDRDSTPELPQSQDEQIGQWQTLYDQTYRQPTANSDSTFNIVGWNSSYTAQPIPAEQMRQWVSDRVEQILALQPQRVLEIGCGTGLLMFQIAPHCIQYWGTDFSSASIQYLEQQLAKQALPQVKLLQRMATDFEGIEANAFDAVILNSVVQYFPSLDYLLQVLDRAIHTVAPGGFVFIGDVRSLPLLSAFHAAVQLHQADSSVSREQLQQQVQMAIFQETELVIDPAFFHALKLRFGRISQVQVQLTRGRDRNELTQFRYNVILHIEASPSPLDSKHSQISREIGLNWTQDDLSLATARQCLVEIQPDLLRIVGVPNARIMAAVKTAEWLVAETQAPKTAGQIRDALQQLAQSGIDPEEWWDLAAELPYTVDVSWSSAEPTGCYDVIFQHQRVTKSGDVALQEQTNLARPWETYANNPLQSQMTRYLVPQLRSYLEQNLPEYMMPSAFVVLEALPLTPNGKVNRRALPAPDWVQRWGTDTAPRSPIEQKLASIWADLLGLKRVGIHDNFFQLGGHSLLATQLTSRIRDAFGVELPLRTVFEAPTIASLSQAIADLQSCQKQQDPGIVPLSRDAHRRLRSSLNRENTGR
jgi:ubiquinone/menaquinone biosynthesis C-methylase UbiE/acyl carrier protein